MRSVFWALGLLVISTANAAPGNLPEERRTFTHRSVDRDAYGSGDIQEIANRLREEFNAAAGTNYRSGSYSNKVQGNCPGCTTSVSSRVSHSSNFGRQKSQEELDVIARDLATQMLDDVRDGKLQQSQISASPNWFEQQAAQALESMGMRQSQSQSQFMSSSSGKSYQQQQQQQYGYDRDVEQVDTQQRQRPVFEDSYHTQSTQTSHGSVRPIVSNSQHSIYDHYYEEHVPNYRSRVVYPSGGYEEEVEDTQRHVAFDQRPGNQIYIRPGTGSVRVNFTLSTYNKTGSHPGQGQTHVVTFNRNFTEADKREQIQSIIEEITSLNRSQLRGMDDIISQLVIQLDENSSTTDRQNVQDEIFKLIENIRNQYGAWNYQSPQSQGRVTEEDLLYREVQELVQNFGNIMKNHSTSFSATNCLSTYIKSVQQRLTYEEKQTQAVVIQHEIRRLTEEIRIWNQAQHVTDQERQSQITLLQNEIRELQTILRQWNVPVNNTSDTEQISTHIIKIQNQLSTEAKERQTSLIQTEIERLRQEMQRWQQQKQINEQQREQQVSGIWSEISTLSQIIEQWKQQQSQPVAQNQLSTHIVTIENNLTEEEKDYQTQVIQDEIKRLRQEMEQYTHSSNVNDQRRQSQIVDCRQEISKLTEIIEDWKASKPTITPENQLSTHIIQIENTLTETDKSYQTQLIQTEIQRLREELERWKHLHHVNENKRQDQIHLIHSEMSKLTEIIEEWRNFKPTITPQNQLSTHIVQIQSTLTDQQKEQQTALITTEIQRLREELEKWKHTQNVNEDKRRQQVQLIRQEISQLTEIIQEWKDTKPAIIPGNQMSQHIITIEKTFSEEDRNRQNAVVQNEINRLRDELQRWSMVQNVNEQKRNEQVHLIKSEISKLTEIVEEWKEVSKPVINQSNKLSNHYITIESSLTEQEKVQQSSVIEQEIARLRDEMEKWRQLQHVGDQTKQEQIVEIRQEISKLTEIIQDWREHKPSLVPSDLLSTHVIQIEHNLSDTDKEHQTILIREEIDRLRQELHRWSNMNQVNEQKRQQQIQLITSEITKLTSIVEEWKDTKSTLTPQNQLSVQIITQESGFTEEEKVHKTAQIQSEIERLREEMHRWSQMQNVNEPKRQQQVQMIRTEITKLTKIVDDWRQSQNLLVPEKQLSLHIISIERSLTESDKTRQIPVIRQEIQRLEQELEKWNSIVHVNADRKQQQVMIIWEEITALRRIMDDFSRAQQKPGDGILLSSHMIAIEKSLTEEEKLLQTVTIKEEISRLRTELDRWMKDTNHPNRQREILWIRKEIEKLNEILRSWKLTEAPNNQGQLSAHILTIEHTLSDDQKLQQTIIIKEEIQRLQQELVKWRQFRGDRQEKEQNLFFIRQEINKLNEILASWRALEQIGTGGQMSSYILSIQHSLSAEQKEIEAVKIREEIRRLEQDFVRWTNSNRNQAEKQRQLTSTRNEINILTQILEDWELEKMSPDFSKLSTHILHIDYTTSDAERERNEELIRAEIQRLTVVLEEWRKKNVNEEERHKVVMLIQKEIDLLKSILNEMSRRSQDKGFLSAFIRSIERDLNEEGKYYYSLLIIQEIVRVQKESARWRAANENQENQCWYIQEKNNNISFDQEKQRQLKMMREEIERLVQILKEWNWRKLTNSHWIHKVYTPDYTATTKHPGVFIYDKNGTTTGIQRPPQKLIDKTRGDQPPHHFEEDYISEEELEAEPGIGLYPGKPQVRPEPMIVSSTPRQPQLPPQQTVEVFPTQREYRRREYQKTTISQSVVPQYTLSASASAGGNTQQRRVPIWANTQTSLADVDPTLSGLEPMSQTRPHDVQQTQPIFNEEDDEGQQSYTPFDADPMQKHVQDMEKDLVVQKQVSPKDHPAVEVQKESEIAEIDPEAGPTEKPGFWKKFGDKAKGIFG